MIESNSVNLKQGIGFPGESEKLQKVKTGLPVRRQTGKEPQQMMPFACVMGNACCSTTQKTGKIPLNFHSGKGEIRWRSNKGNATMRGGDFNIDPKNNILSAGKGKTGKTNQSLPLKGKGIAESSHGAILKGEEAKGLKLSMHMHASNGGEETKDINPFMDASKGKRTKTSRSFSGKIDYPLPRRSVGTREKQTEGKVKNLSGSSGLKNSENGKDEIIGQRSEVREQRAEVRGQRSEVRDQRAKMEDASGLLKFSLKNADAVKGKTAVGENFRTGKIAVAVSKDGGFRESVAGINNALVRGQRSEIRGQRSEVRSRKLEVRGQKAKMEDAAGFLKSSLKNAVAVKGKSAVEPDKTEKNSFTLTKNDSGKNEIKDILRNSGLKSGETIEILHRKISSPSHSDKISSAGAYHHTSFHSGGSSAAVNESVNSSGIEPRTLINQIANSVKIPGRVRITLNPPSLGTLDVDVLVRDNKVHVIMQAENNDVRHILQSNVESLKSSLRNHGLVADAINVLVQEKSDGADHGANYRSGQNETLFKEGRNRGGNEENQGGEQNSLNHNPPSFEEENPHVRSDGRVSLFA